MKKYTKFLLTPSETLSEKLRNILTGIAINVIVVAIVLMFYNWLFEMKYLTITLPAFIHKTMMGVIKIPIGYKHEQAIAFVGSVILAPFGEELVFRHLPLQAFKALMEYKGLTRKFAKSFLLPAILAGSVIFAWCHEMEAFAIPMQGIGGFLMASVYVKNGYSYWSSVSMHMFWNLSLFVALYSFL